MESVTANTFVSAVGNIIGGNVNVAGLANIVGNVVGGNLITAGIGNIGTLEVVTLANIKAVTAASNVTTGALTVAGGAGIAGSEEISRFSSGFRCDAVSASDRDHAGRAIEIGAVQEQEAFTIVYHAHRYSGLQVGTVQGK